MSKNYVRFIIKNNFSLKELKIDFMKNLESNMIIELEHDFSSVELFSFLNNFNKKSLKSVVLISKKHKDENHLFSVVPTFQEAVDIIQIEEIERLIS